MSARWRLGALCAVALLIASPSGAQDDAVRAKIRETIATLAGSGGVSFDDDDFAPSIDEPPPPAVAEAGDGFVGAWRELRHALALQPSAAAAVAATPSAPAPTAPLGPPEFQSILTRLTSGDDPPSPQEVDAALVMDRPSGGCGTGYIMFGMFKQRALLLANLRHGRYGEALRIQLEPEWVNDSDMAGGRAELLAALGFDWRRVVAGAWLDGRDGMLESIAADPSDETAQLVLAWAERHWAQGVELEQARREYRYRDPGPLPQLPQRELVQLLAADQVSAETKARVAAFLNANATRLHDEDYWLRDLPRSSAPWLEPLARSAVKHERNEVRQLGLDTLRAAGVVLPLAALRPDPTYRIVLDGVPWEADERREGIGIDYMRPGSSMAGSIKTRRDGVIVIDADRFAPLRDILRAYIYRLPDGRADSPWFRATIPLPPDYGEMTDLQVETATVTVRPRFARPVDPGTQIEIGMLPADGPLGPDMSGVGPYVYRVQAAPPIVLSRLQRGRYWLRIRAPGAALSEWEAVDATGPTVTVRPTLPMGATVYIPIAWRPGIDKRDWDLLGASTVERDGQPLDAVAKNLTSDGTDVDQLVLRDLPIGAYRVRLSPDGPEQSFSITRRSPAEMTLPPLEVIAAR